MQKLHPIILGFLLLALVLAALTIWSFQQPDSTHSHHDGTPWEWSEGEVEPVPPGSTREEAQPADRSLAEGTPLSETVGPALVVRVVERANGNPIEGAEVEVRSFEMDFLTAGRTRASGEFVVSGNAERLLYVQASARGFASDSTWGETGEPGSVCELALATGAELRGRVRVDEDWELPTSCLVVAWPASGMGPTSGSIRALLDGEPTSLLWTRVESDGAFTIEGVKNGVMYSLAAGAPGHLSVPERGQSGGREVELKLGKLVGCDFMLVGPAGEPIETAVPVGALSVGVPGGAGLDAVAPGNALLSLCGIAPELPPSHGLLSRRFIYRAFTDAAIESANSVRAFAAVPGFELLQAETALALISDAVPRAQVRLTRTSTDGYGTARFSFGVSDLLGAGTSGRPPAQLELSDQAIPEYGWKYALPTLAEDFVLEGLPLGRYSYQIVPDVDLRALEGSESALNGTFTLSGELTEVPVQIVGYGGVDLQVRDANGDHFTESTVLVLVPGSAAHPNPWIRVSRPVERLDLIPAGEYALAMPDPMTGQAGKELARFQVLPGQITAVPLVLPE